MVVEDIDFRGHFCYPDCSALWRFVELYTEVVRRKGADANIGPRLPGLLMDAGFENVQMNVVQPAAVCGALNLIKPHPQENIADAVVAEGLASAAEVGQLVEALYRYAETPGSVGCMARVVQAWGYQPKA
jgi:hypothetical protein